MSINLGPFQRLACMAGSHHRNRKRVRLQPLSGTDGYSTAYVAPCAGCGIRMIKGPAGWAPVGADDPIEIAT